MSHRIDLWFVTIAADERIVGWDAAVVAYSQHFAAVVFGILRVIGVAAVRHEDRTVPAEGDSRRAGARFCDKDIANIHKRLSIPSSTPDGIRRARALQWFGIR